MVGQPLNRGRTKSDNFRIGNDDEGNGGAVPGLGETRHP